MTGFRATISTPTTMAQPTPNTIHLVTLGVTQMDPMIGDAAMSSAKRYSPGEFWIISRITAA